MSYVYDRVTGALEKYAAKNAEGLVQAIFGLLGTPRGPIAGLEKSAAPDAYGEALRQNSILTQEMQQVCLRNDRFRLLILARKVPFAFLASLMKHSELTGKLGARILHHTFCNAALVATNYVLKYSGIKSLPQSINDRNTLAPREEELRDAIVLSVCSFFRNHNENYMHTLAHRNCSEEVSFEHLTSSYNERQGTRISVEDIASEVDGNVLLALTTPAIFRGAERVTFRYVEERQVIHLLVPNYFPLSIKADAFRTSYSYLDVGGFRKRTGLSFETFYTCWLALQRLVLRSLPLTWIPGSSHDIISQQEKWFVERIFDVWETALGGASNVYLVEQLAESRKTYSSDLDFSEHDTRSFLKWSTCTDFNGNVNFPEQRYLFYDVGNGVVVWDYLRHLGFWKSIARGLVAVDGEIGRRKGAVLEDELLAGISKMVGVSQLKKNVKVVREKRSGVFLEIDVGFVVGEVLVVIEAKSWFKRIAVYEGNFDEVADRTQKLGSVLQNFEERLKIAVELLHKHWKLADVRGYLPIVLCNEAEFTPSLEPQWWLVVGQMPRICLPEEVMRFLKSEYSSRLHELPGFVPFFCK